MDETLNEALADFAVAHPDRGCPACGATTYYDAGRDTYVHRSNDLMACPLGPLTQRGVRMNPPVRPRPSHRPLHVAPEPEPAETEPQRHPDKRPDYPEHGGFEQSYRAAYQRRDGRYAGACPGLSSGGVRCGGERFHVGAHMGLNAHGEVIVWGEKLSPSTPKPREGRAPESTP